MKKNDSIRVFDTVDSLFKSALSFILDQAQRSISERNRFSMVLSGGQTPERLYELMAQPAFASQMEWDKTYIFWGDERCVPLNDEQNNAHQAKKILLDKIKIPQDHIFRIPVDLHSTEAARDYEKTIKLFFGETYPQFDLILLGLGTNGHTASLFPHTTALHETERLVTEVWVEELKMYRITMTVPLINRARQILFLVTGESKAGILNKVLNGDYKPHQYPAQLIKPDKGNLSWFTDKDAAGKLE